MPPHPKATQQRGSVLVYFAMVLVVFGVLAMAGATRYGSSIVGVSLPNCATSARLMSEAGMRYAVARLRSCTTVDEVNTAVAAMNGVTYTVDAAKGLRFTTTVSYNSGTNTATVSASGLGCPSSMSAAAASTAAASVNLPGISTASEASTSEALKGTYSGTSAIAAGSMTGNLTTNAAMITGGSTVGGSVNFLGTGPTCLHIGGGATVGTSGNNNYVCSASCVVVDGGAVVNGDIYAQGDVYVSSTVNGDIHSGGNVTLWWGADVSGNIHAHGTFSSPPYFTSYRGTVTTGAAVPSLCESYTLPAHETVASSTALHVTGQYTFYGTTDLSDRTNAFTSISSSGGSKICFDLSTPDSYINIFNRGSMTIRGDVYVRTSTSTPCFNSSNKVSNINFAAYEHARRVYMDVGGTVTFAGGSNWFGTVYAAGNIYPGGGGSYIGAFYTNSAYNPFSIWSYTRFVASDYVAKYWP